MKPEQIKLNLNKRVRYKNEQSGIDAEYTLTGAIFRKDKGSYFYQAELQDVKNNNSIVICSLDQVEAISQEAT